MNVDKIVAPFQLIGTKILKFTLTNDYVAFSPQSPIKCDASYSIESVEKQDELYTGIIRLQIKSVFKGRDKSKLSCNTHIEGCFAAGDMDEDTFRKMLGINGCASLFSIARAFICSTTALATSGGQMILPMINTFKLIEGETDKETE